MPLAKHKQHSKNTNTPHHTHTKNHSEDQINCQQYCIYCTAHAAQQTNDIGARLAQRMRTRRPRREDAAKALSNVKHTGRTSGTRLHTTKVHAHHLTLSLNALHPAWPGACE